MLEIPLEARPELRILMSRADTLVQNAGKRDQLFPVLAVDIVGNRLAHADKYAGRAELIAVMENGARIDGGKIGDEKACMKGTQIDDPARQQPVSVEQLHKTHHQRRQERQREPGR